MSNCRKDTKKKSKIYCKKKKRLRDPIEKLLPLISNKMKSQKSEVEQLLAIEFTSTEKRFIISTNRATDRPTSKQQTIQKYKFKKTAPAGKMFIISFYFHPVHCVTFCACSQKAGWLDCSMEQNTTPIIHYYHSTLFTSIYSYVAQWMKEN